jgi:hypothetical protein
MKPFATTLTVIAALASVIGVLVIWAGIADRGYMPELITGASMLVSGLFLMLLAQIGWHCADMSESLRTLAAKDSKQPNTSAFDKSDLRESVLTTENNRTPDAKKPEPPPTEAELDRRMQEWQEKK